MPDTMHRNDVADVLRRARKLIENEGDWWDGQQQRGSNSACALQAIMRTTPVAPVEMRNEATCRLREAIVSMGGGFYITEFNDTHTHPEVLAAFDKAIAGATP